MEIEAYNGPQPPPLSLRDEPARPKKPAKPKYPVAKPATPVPSIRPDEADQPADLVEDLLSPPSIKGFAWSLAGHSIFLLILGFWYFAPVVGTTKVIDTRLAGSEFGDPMGDQLKGGQGMDTPLAMPLNPAAPVLQEMERTITSIPVSQISTPEAVKKDNAGAANGGGVNLSKPGQAGNGDGFGVAKFGQGGENINGIDVKVGDPQFTLIWDSRADLDLHVIEPGGSEIYWENRNGNQGGELDVDDVDGFGPENINYVQGKGPRGTYRWHVHYYGGLGGLAQNTKWKVRVKYANKTEVFNGKFSRIGEKSEPKKLILTGEGPKNEVAKAEPKESPEKKASPASRASSVTPAPVAKGPIDFAPTGAGFSVQIPGEAKAGSKDYETTIGTVVAQTYLVEQSEGAINIATMAFPASSIAKADPAKLLDELANKALIEAKGKAIGTSKIALKDAIGKEVDFTVPEAIVSGGGLGRIRVYLVAGRVTILSAVGTKGFFDSPDTSDFFKTFAISDSK